MKRGEKHARASTEKCADCGTPLVLIGHGSEQTSGRKIWSHANEHWSWYQCPYCGLYTRISLFDSWPLSTLDQREVDIHERLIPDPFEPSEGYSATWPVTQHCLACQGIYQVSAIRTWQSQESTLVPKTEKTPQRLPVESDSLQFSLQKPLCHCEHIEEGRGNLEQVLEALPQECILLIPEEHTSKRMWAAKYLIEQCGALVTVWPYPLKVTEALIALRTYGPDPDYPHEINMYFAWSPSAQQGTIWSEFKSRPESIWARIVL